MDTKDTRQTYKQYKERQKRIAITTTGLAGGLL